ncbi:hypothetical protein BXZ70DRAFT_934397 [Cristinia sonorae]|uniref:Uncharacterized protein n=1 Tax=Cristinia sonorae TaxID=1940300 RepID=A0A8K0URI7_9AGAR|nr:hypothetical protein BXZ70DRAFT_934397 [Cristinia sonorae]
MKNTSTRNSVITKPGNNDERLNILRELLDARIEEIADRGLATSEIAWLESAWERTQDYYTNGPQGSVSWVLMAAGMELPQGAFIAGKSPDGQPAYTARGYMQTPSYPVGTLQVGRTFEFGGAFLGWGWMQFNSKIYEILVASPADVCWVPTKYVLNIAALGAIPVEGGYEAPAGEPLYVAQAFHQRAWRPGKASAQLQGAFIPFNGSEVCVEEYRVLCYVDPFT